MRGSTGTFGRRGLTSLAVVTLLAGFAGVGFGQTATGTITGTVSDANGGAPRTSARSDRPSTAPRKRPRNVAGSGRTSTSTPWRPGTRASYKLRSGSATSSKPRFKSP